ncbi:uncharacterized protein LOC122264079 [Penaeus japonicus]|uniref:uncharacterized protein LOC122264079 n=1 Tax=Penaeus japonicus TaxID=27405 RepID=UPI001C70D41C|nr:uncharacterized protein LOC122264079 [Penaeus japonicus]
MSLLCLLLISETPRVIKDDIEQTITRHSTSSNEKETYSRNYISYNIKRPQLSCSFTSITRTVNVFTMAKTAKYCPYCQKKLTENHLCLLCTGCSQHIPSARLSHHRRHCIKGGTGKASKGVKILPQQSSLQGDNSAGPSRSTPASPQPGPSRRLSPFPQPGKHLENSDVESSSDEEMQPSHPHQEITSSRANKKTGDSDIEINSEDENGDDDLETPHIAFRTELFQGAAVRLGFTIPDQDQTSPHGYLRRNENYFSDILQTYRLSLEHPPPGVKAYTSFTITLSKTDLTTGGVREIVKNITLCSYLITSDADCRKTVRGWAEEAEAKLEEWLTEEGSGLDLDAINSHEITAGQIRVPQAIGNYIAYPKEARGGNFIFNPRGNVDCVIRSLAAGKLLATGKKKKTSLEMSTHRLNARK